MTSGIYSITSPSGKNYIGSSKNIDRRWYEHKSDLRLGEHHSPALQHAFDKYGEARLLFNVVLICSEDNLLMYEDLCMNAMGAHYNALPFARRRDNFSHTAESKRKLSEAHKGRKNGPRSEETKKRISDALKAAGVRPPGNRGIAHSQETREKLSIAAKKRMPRKQTEEEKAKRAASLKPYWDAMKGRPGRKQTEEEKAKRVASVKAHWATVGGKPSFQHTDEAKEKMSAALKASWARRKAKNDA